MIADAYDSPAKPSDKPEAGRLSAPIRSPGRWIRFGLLELLLLTAVVAAWLPALMVRSQIPVLQSEIENLRLVTTDLIISDEAKLNVCSLPAIFSKINSWKYSVASDANLELRLATVFVNSVGYPTKYEAIALPAGEHSIDFKCTKDEEGFHSIVYLDDEVVLQQHHPKTWLATHGSSSTSVVSRQSKAYELDKPLKLKVQRFEVDHPLSKYKAIDIPDEYDSKGNFLWISPASEVPKSPSVFYVSPNTRGQIGAGHRQGISVFRSDRLDLNGLIGISPSLSSTLGDNRDVYPYCPLGISVRPVTVGQTPANDTEAQFASPPADLLTLSDTIVRPVKIGDSESREAIVENAIASDGKTMRVFAHFKRLTSGALPIVEILFDAEHPNRIGFLPRASAGSTPMEAVQFVTQFDTRFLWREVELREDAETVAGLYGKIDSVESSDSEERDGESRAWREIPLAKLPRELMLGANVEMFRLSLATDVVNATKLKYPAGLNEKWRYTGIPNRQVWWLPTAEAESAPKAKVEVRAGSVYPATRFAIPGGPAIQNVRITVPVPATEPVWLEIVGELPAAAK